MVKPENPPPQHTLYNHQHRKCKLTVKHSLASGFVLLSELREKMLQPPYEAQFICTHVASQNTPARCNSGKSLQHTVDFHTLMSSAAVNKTPE